MASLHRMTPCLWFDHQAEDAAKLYTSIFPNSKITKVTRYGTAGQEVHHRPPGSAMTVEFELEGQPFTGLNGGPVFQFTEAISFQVFCDTQEEIDTFWDKLSAGGDPRSQQCGWLKDRFGLSWQIVPRKMGEWMSTPGAGDRVMKVMLSMKKLDIAQLERAAHG